MLNEYDMLEDVFHSAEYEIVNTIENRFQLLKKMGMARI